MNKQDYDKQQIFDDNIGLVYKFVRTKKYSVPTLDVHDFEQEMLISYCKAIKTYDEQYGKLSTYVYTVLENRLRQLLVYIDRRHIGRDISYDKTYEDDGDSYSYMELLEEKGEVETYDTTATTAEKYASYMIDVLLRHTALAKKERQTIDLMLQGLSYTDIAKLSNITPAGASYTGTSALKKLRQSYDKLVKIGIIPEDMRIHVTKKLGGQKRW